VGIGFAWWQLTQSQNASLIGLVTAIVAVVSALVARSTVEPVQRQPADVVGR
jgi:putative Mn2+ efflux pump MntP